jgi:hypothetical protein
MGDEYNGLATLRVEFRSTLNCSHTGECKSEDHEEIETVARGADTAVRGWADEVAEGGQELEEDGGRVSFRVWGEAANNATRDTVESRDGKRGWRGRGGSGWKRDRWQAQDITK